jgi:hypothetical protein
MCVQIHAHVLAALRHVLDVYIGGTAGRGQPEGTLIAYVLTLVTICPYELTKLKWRHKSTGEPPLVPSQCCRPRGQRIRVSLEIEPRRVGMPPKIVCEHMLCTLVW